MMLSGIFKQYLGWSWTLTIYAGISFFYALLVIGLKVHQLVIKQNRDVEAYERDPLIKK